MTISPDTSSPPRAAPDLEISLLRYEREITEKDLRIARLEESLSEMKVRLDWLNKQLFGKKSELRSALFQEAQGSQLWLGEPLEKVPDSEPETTITVPAHERNKRGSKQRGPELVTSEGLRFGPETPVVEVLVPEGEETRDIPSEMKEYLPPEVSYRLAQQKSAFYVEKIVRPKVKVKSDLPTLYTAPAPPSVFPGSFASTSFLAGLLVQKYCFHMPLYRMYQMLLSVGIVIARMTLTTLEHKLGALLAPLVDAIHKRALTRGVIIMDETPRKVWIENEQKLKQSYMWMLRTETEVFFAMGPDRSHRVVYELLGTSLQIVLVTDGYGAYDTYAADERVLVTHAYCWAHFRRCFIKAETQDKKLAATALDLYIGKLYDHEREIQKIGLSGDAKKEYRQTHSKPIVEEFKTWLDQTHRELSLLPKSPLAAACAYGLNRWEGLNVFLEYPDVPIDTNSGEREMRPHAVGRKNWLFNMSERGSDYVASFYTILQTCKLNGVDPHDYLTDVLPRLESYPRDKLAELTPAHWKKERLIDSS